ncbi:MAG: hypothetical protein ACR2PL_22990 [Dehalococcoidia bacterium]
MTRVTLDLPLELHRRLRAVARETGSSLDDVIVRLLDATTPPCAAEEDAPAKEETPLERERRLVREALRYMTVEIDLDEYAPLFKGLTQGLDRQAFFESLPRLDPPLSQTIIEEREDRI